MPESVLCTAELPAFDRKSGQLALASHHLLSAPLSVVEAYGAASTLLFDPPPERPYQKLSSDEGVLPAGLEGPKRKRRRVARAPDETSSAVDWIRHREREEARPTTDRESDAHHAEVAPGLQAAIEAVQAGWQGAGREGEVGRWTGEQDRYEWRGADASDTRSELGLVGLVSSGDVAARQSPLDGPLALSGDASVPALSLAGRLVTNECIDKEVQLHLTDTESETQLCLPPSSGFLLSDMSAWSDARSGIAELGQAKGGWDILLLESVLLPLATRSLLLRHTDLARCQLGGGPRRSVRLGPTFRPRGLRATRLSIPTISGNSTSTLCSATSPQSLPSG